MKRPLPLSQRGLLWAVLVAACICDIAAITLSVVYFVRHGDWLGFIWCIIALLTSVLYQRLQRQLKRVRQTRDAMMDTTKQWQELYEWQNKILSQYTQQEAQRRVSLDVDAFGFVWGGDGPKKPPIQ